MNTLDWNTRSFVFKRIYVFIYLILIQGLFFSSAWALPLESRSQLLNQLVFWKCNNKAYVGKVSDNTLGSTTVYVQVKRVNGEPVRDLIARVAVEALQISVISMQVSPRVIFNQTSSQTRLIHTLLDGKNHVGEVNRLFWDGQVAQSKINGTVEVSWKTANGFGTDDDRRQYVDLGQVSWQTNQVTTAGQELHSLQPLASIYSQGNPPYFLRRLFMRDPMNGGMNPKSPSRSLDTAEVMFAQLGYESEILYIPVDEIEWLNGRWELDRSHKVLPPIASGAYDDRIAEDLADDVGELISEIGRLDSKLSANSGVSNASSTVTNTDEASWVLRKNTETLGLRSKTQFERGRFLPPGTRSKKVNSFTSFKGTSNSSSRFSSSSGSSSGSDSDSGLSLDSATNLNASATEGLSEARRKIADTAPQLDTNLATRAKSPEPGKVVMLPPQKRFRGRAKTGVDHLGSILEKGSAADSHREGLAGYEAEEGEAGEEDGRDS